MKTAAKHFENATFHFETVRNVYNNVIKTMNVPKGVNFNVMDIGCGSGKLLNEILDPILPKNCKNLIGTDKNEEMIKFCKTLKGSSRIQYEILDISTKNLPGKFKNNFNLLFSSYCFMYVNDISQALKNCNEMLKPSGELLFLFLAKKNFIHSTYKEMYHSNDIWKQYTKDYANFIPLFHGEDCDAELLDLFNKANLQVIKHEFLPELTMSGTGKQLLELSLAMDTIYPKIPEELKASFRRDFLEIISLHWNIDVNNEKVLYTKQDIPASSVIIHAKKN